MNKWRMNFTPPTEVYGRSPIEAYIEEACIDRRTLRPPYRLRVDQREIIDCLKRNFILAAQYYETSEFNLMQGSKSGMELGKVMKRELGYSANSYWWDIIHWRLHLYLIAKREIRECMFKTPPIQQVLDFLDAQEKENLTRGTTKGSTMHDEMRRPGDIGGPETCPAEKTMSIKRHKQITDLAYELKAAMDKKMPDLKGNELCMLGEIMQRIGQLK